MMRALAIAVALASAGCGLFDAIYWRRLLSEGEVCARYEELRVIEERCGLDTAQVREEQCNAAECFTNSDNCDAPWEALVDCLFNVREDECPPPEETRHCEALENDYASCRGRTLSTCDGGGSNCPPSDGFCGGGEQGCPDCNADCPPADGLCESDEAACPDCFCPPPDGRCQAGEEACPDCFCPPSDGLCDADEAACIDCVCPPSDGFCGGEPTFCPDCRCPPPDGFCDGAEPTFCADCNGSSAACTVDADCPGQVCSAFCADAPAFCDDDVAACRDTCASSADCASSDGVCVLYDGRRACERDACGDCTQLCADPNTGNTNQGICSSPCDPLACPDPTGPGDCPGCSFPAAAGGCIPALDGADVVDFFCAPVAGAPVDDTCQHADDCRPGAICHQGVCRELCAVGSNTCTAGASCTAFFDVVGICL